MSMKRLVNEIKEMRDEISCSWIGRLQRKRATRRGRAHIAPEAAAAAALGSGSSSDPLALCVSWCDLSEDERRRRSSSSSTWANMPPELLHSIIKRVEGGQTSWPGRRDVVACASVCKSWRQITKDAVQTPEQCGCLTFPISLKQPGPRDAPIQCFIKRDRATSTYQLYLGLSPALSGDMSKLLLAAKKIRRATCTEFQISFVSGDFCQTSNTYVGKLRSNFLGTKFTIYDSQPPHPAMQSNCKKNRRIHSIKVSPQVQAVNYDVGAISYELNILRTRGPRRIGCTVQSIPISAIQEGGTAPTPMDFTSFHDEQFHSTSTSKSRQPLVEFSSISLADSISGKREPLVLKNKAPRWHEQLQCWCLNFKGRVTVASVKNFQLVAAVEPCQNVPTEEQEKVILQFGKIGKDIFTMDYRYPLSAFQAFAVCLSSFDTKPACE